VSFTDVNLDPEDLPKALVNSFVFSPERLFVGAAEGVSASPPEIADGRGPPRAGAAPGHAGSRLLRIAYQVNEAGSAAPAWRDVVEAEAEIALAPGGVTRVRLLQDRGVMDYARRRMRNVESFRATLEASPPESSEPPAP
jgi:hypothetical protein